MQVSSSIPAVCAERAPHAMQSQFTSPDSRITQEVVEACLDLLTDLQKPEHAHLRDDPLMNEWVGKMVRAVGFDIHSSRSGAK